MEPVKKRKGNLPPGPGPGRPKGVPNKVTTAFRETVQRLLDENAENVSRWLQSVADGDPENNVKPDPGKALDLMSKLAEYATPKLSRSELANADDKPLAHKIVFEVVDPKNG